MSKAIIVFLLACEMGLDPIHDECLGGRRICSTSDTARDEFPPLDKEGNIICDDTGVIYK